MSDIVWFDRRSPHYLPTVMPHPDDPCCLIVGANMPDWVRLPNKPEFGDNAGRAMKVTAYCDAPCVGPNCPAAKMQGAAHTTRHYLLEDRYGVCECQETQQFFWYRMRENQKIVQKPA